VIFVQAHIALPTTVIGLLDVVRNSGQPINFLFHLLEMVHEYGLHHGGGPQQKKFDIVLLHETIPLNFASKADAGMAPLNYWQGIQFL
jgi:hypothetical protein